MRAYVLVCVTRTRARVAARSHVRAAYVWPYMHQQPRPSLKGMSWLASPGLFCQQACRPASIVGGAEADPLHRVSLARLRMACISC